MEILRIQGGSQIRGSIEVEGAKNSALVLMMGALLTEQEITLTNVPKLRDIDTASELLKILGAKISASQNVLKIRAVGEQTIAPYDVVRTMRASVLCLGPLLARFGYAKVSLPGGCAIGARPVDLHLQVFEKAGASISVEEGYIHAKAPSGGLRPVDHQFPFVSVGATENALMALSLVPGTSHLRNCAKEPEITQLCQFLESMGATITGVGTDHISITGTKTLKGTTTRVIADRIVAGTLLIAGAITGGSVTVKMVERDIVGSTIAALEAMGVNIEISGNDITASGLPQKGIEITTAPFPGFATDMQAQLMALCCLAPEPSTIRELIFENRFMHIPEMSRLGAKIHTSGNTAVISPYSHLSGAVVMASDLRASAGLVLLGLAAKGETTLRRIYHLDRGYEFLDKKLNSLGAKIVREKEEA